MNVRRSRLLISESNLYRLLACALTFWIVSALWLHSRIFWMDTSWTFSNNDYVSAVQDLALPHAKYIPHRSPTPFKANPTKSSASASFHQGGEINHDNKKPLNILLLYADDWRWDSLGVQGNPFVRTPFLDRLAQERGIRFERNMVTTSICWMSRATLHTGLYASKHQGWTPEQPFWYHHWYESFPYLMKKEHNYAMAHVGKWDYKYFHDIPELWQTYNFSRIYHAKHWYSKEEIDQEINEQTQTTGQPHYETKYKIRENDQVHITDRTVADSMEFFKRRPKNKPFMLTVAFFPPHSVDGTDGQFYPQPETATFYPANNLTILPPVPPAFTVENMNQSFARLPPSIFPNDGEGNEARTRWHLRFDNVAKYNAMMKRYYQMITGVDNACEKLVAELERQGILNDTLVIFTTDNGFYHGEHGLAGKWFPHEESIRVPLIIMDPRAPSSSHGTAKDELTLNIDLAPTLLSAAQVSIPQQMQGMDLAQLYTSTSTSSRRQQQAGEAKGQSPWREEFYYEYPEFWDEIFLPASTALVRKSHKYIQWGSKASNRVEQLFDLIKDPQEEKDVSQDPNYESILRGMRKRHKELQRECCLDVDNMIQRAEKLTPPPNSWVDPIKDDVADLASQMQDWRSTG